MLGQSRATQRRPRQVPADEPRLVGRITALASDYGRYGYRRITALLRRKGWRVNHKRVERLWRREGLKVPQRQRKRRRLWFNDGSCIRLRPKHRDHVWSYDFVQARTHDGRSFRMLTVIDEFTREPDSRSRAKRVAPRMFSTPRRDALRVNASLTHLQSETMRNPATTCEALRV